jgi:ATP-dependent 26S proteasome regulatory subunit
MRCRPELLRKGRFDEIFFVDLPARGPREQLFALHLRRRALEPCDVPICRLCPSQRRFSGAEIEQAIVAALYAAHADEGAANDSCCGGNSSRPHRCRC